MARIVVVGAGPAGLAAAQAAARAGVSVLLVDSAASVGGQYWRQSAVGAVRRPVHPLVEWLPSSAVWGIEVRADRVLLRVQSGPADAPGRLMSTVEGSAVVLATGAYDRVLPVPGWDLPGVYSAGAGQAMAKGQGVAVGKRVVVAGTGPFLLPVACSLLDFGAEVVGVMEASGVREQVGWWRDPVGVVGKVGELGRYVTRLAYSRVEMQMRAAVVAVHGDRRVEAVTVARLRPDWTVVPGSGRVVDVDAVCLGFGFTAQLELAVSAGCRVEDGAVVVDGAQRTSVPRVFAAGELTGVAGAWAAVAEGTVAGYTAAADCVDSQVVPPTPALKRAAAGRRFGRVLRSVYRVKKGWHGWVSDDTVLCRCEEIRWADLRDQLAQGVLGTRALRLNSRAGLGLCQGRVCGRNVADLTGLPDSANRPIALPVRLSDLATADLPKEST